MHVTCIVLFVPVYPEWPGYVLSFVPPNVMKKIRICVSTCFCVCMCVYMHVYMPVSMCACMHSVSSKRVLIMGMYNGACSVHAVGSVLSDAELS